MKLLNAINELYFEMTLNELKLLNRQTIYPNISYNSLLYLDIIAYKDGCTVSYLAEALHISKSAVTIKINELISQGFVVKNQSNIDKRVNFLHVSDAFKQDFALYNKKLKKAVNSVESNYSKEDIVTFCKIINLIRKTYMEEVNNERQIIPSTK